MEKSVVYLYGGNKEYTIWYRVVVDDETTTKNKEENQSISPVALLSFAEYELLLGSHLYSTNRLLDKMKETAKSTEGPPAGTAILLNNLVIKHAAKPPPPSPPVIEDAGFGVNIIANTNLNDGTNGWFPLENCTMSVQTGSPHIMPPMARDSVGAHEPLSGRYILVTSRTQNWMGPSQMITDKVKLYLTYQVSAWVEIGQASGPQNVNVALGVDSQWVNGGQAEISSDRWHEIGGSLRIEKKWFIFRVLLLV
ncbi:hypothetical protein FXO38_04740 [Capsicum annuum]|nr:hypothetical protein FXO38_04740 [Capsicum annuum]